MQFEDLAVSLATLASYARDELSEPFKDLDRLYGRSLQTPPDYREITALTGHSLNGRDQHSGRAAWLLMNTEGLKIYGVHSHVWHKTAGKFYAPLLDQMSLALGVDSRLGTEDAQAMGVGAELIDVVGVKDDSIWLVKVITSERVMHSAIGRVFGRSGHLFRECVYGKESISGQDLSALHTAKTQMKAAFPRVNISTLVLVLHPKSPDFELYQVEIPAYLPESIELREGMIIRNSIDFTSRIAEDMDSIFRLPKLLESPVFEGVPPCRGGRTLGTLAAAVTRQLNSDELLTWERADFLKMLRSEFKYEVENDKLRHDLDVRLTGQGFFRKWGPTYYVSMRGIARYQYCLAKFTTLGAKSFNLDLCVKQRDRIMDRFGCLN